VSDNLVTLTIDGKTVRVPRGTLVVEAAKQIGITIPVFCYHHQMKPYGACRMCLVEITPGPPLPQTACTSPVAEGMVVKTKSPMAVSAQKANVEFLLLNHPLDCPVCDRGGECPLQDNTFGFGGAESRYLEEKRHYVKPLALSDEVLLDRERCILCYRCVRFCREIAGDESLTVIERGTDSQIGLAPGRTFDSPFSGNTIEICPVGALTSTRYRFAARPWDIKSVATICPHCPVGCNVRADVRNNEIKRFLSRENLGVDDGWLCDRGRFGYAFPSGSDRILAPMVRRDGQLVETSWAEAIDAVQAGLSAVLSTSGGASIAGLAGCQLTNEDLFYFKKLLSEGLQSPNLDHTLRPHPASPIGPDAASATIQGIDRSDVVVVVGADPIVDQPVLDLRLKKAANRGAALVVIGPKQTDLVKYARTWLKTGEEATVIEALLQLLPEELATARANRQKAAEAAADRAFADAVKRAHDAAVARAKEAGEPEPAPYATPAEGGERYGITRQSPPPQPQPRAQGVDQLIAALGTRTVEERAAAAGVPAEALKSAARIIGGGERVTIVYPRERGADRAFLNAATNLGLLTDAVDRPGAGLMPLVRETNQQGAIDMGVHPLPSRGDGRGPGEVAPIAGADMIGAVNDGRLKAMYVVGRCLADEPGALEALRKLEFLVVQDYHMTETARLAHVVLPGLTFAEKDGSYTNLDRRVQRLRQALQIRGQARPDWRIFRDVLNALGGASFVADAGDVFAEIAASVPGYGEVTFGRLGFKGIQIPYQPTSYQVLV
jgi:NADH-quinone oxidoreductase subunit G